MWNYNLLQYGAVVFLVPNIWYRRHCFPYIDIISNAIETQEFISIATQAYGKYKR